MKPVDYSQREIGAVTLESLSIGTFSDGTPALQISLSIALSSLDNPLLMGPGIDVGLAIPLDGSTAVQDLEAVALKSAHSLLKRIAQESSESVETLLRITRERNILPKQ